jgi:hypothetical protein
MGEHAPVVHLEVSMNQARSPQSRLNADLDRFPTNICQDTPLCVWKHASEEMKTGKRYDRIA